MRFGWAGVVSSGRFWFFKAGKGKVRYGRHGVSSCGKAVRGKARQAWKARKETKS